MDLADFYREMEARDIHVSSPSGEMTVTLQDVAVLLGLHIDDLPVTGTITRIGLRSVRDCWV